MTVQMILKEKGRGVVTVQGGQSLEETARVLEQRRIGAVVVVNQAGRVTGVLSERDIVRAIAAHGCEALTRPVREFMTTDVVTCAPADSVDAMMERMTDRRCRHLPVVDGPELIGIVSIGDLVKQRIAATELEAAALRQYIVAG